MPLFKLKRNGNGPILTLFYINGCGELDEIQIVDYELDALINAINDFKKSDNEKKKENEVGF